MFAYQRIVPSLYIAAFLFILLGCASSNVEGEYTGDGVASNVSTQEGDKLANEMKDANQAQHFANQINRLKSFLRYYCQTYENKDLDKFAALFTPDALENNKPFYLLLPKYRRNMDIMESLTYRIDLGYYSLGTDTDNIMVQGKYFTGYMYEGTLKGNSGDISMKLIENGDSYLVKQLDYVEKTGF